MTGPKDIVTEEYLGVLGESDLSEAARKALRVGCPTKRADYVRSHYSWRIAGEQFVNGVRTYC